MEEYLELNSQLKPKNSYKEKLKKKDFLIK